LWIDDFSEEMNRTWIVDADQATSTIGGIGDDVIFAEVKRDSVLQEAEGGVTADPEDERGDGKQQGEGGEIEKETMGGGEALELAAHGGRL
jgi:hypothetical protein